MFGDVVEQLIERYYRLAKDKDVTLVVRSRQQLEEEHRAT